MGWALPYQSFIKKIPHRIAYEPMWWMYFLNLSSLFQYGPDLYQIGKKLKQNKI